MTATVKRINPTQVELVIPIVPDELRQAEERAFRKLAKVAKLPGFRPGKVPRKIFEQTYGAETITDKAMEDLVPEIYTRALRENDLEPVDRPKMELIPADGGSKTLKATVEVCPQISLGAYKGLELTSQSPPVTDEDVDRSLQTLARDRATLVPVDREARLGDVVSVDYEGRVDGELFEGGAAKGQTIELTEGRFIPGFASGIAGMHAGENKEVEAEFPATYPQPQLAGKHATFSVSLHEVKEVELPAIDDDFAKSISENKTVDELRADLRRRLEAIAQARERRLLGNEAVEKLVNAHSVVLPQTLVEREIHNMIAETQAAGETGKSPDQLSVEFKPEAERRVKARLLLEAVAKAEKIVATPVDIQRELQSLAAQYGQPVERVRRALGSGVLSLMEGIVRGKTIDFLVENAGKQATPGAAS